MFCKSCGKQIHDDSKFCAYCGAALAEPAVLSPQTLVPQSAVTQSQPLQQTFQIDQKEVERRKKHLVEARASAERGRSLALNVIIWGVLFLIFLISAPWLGGWPQAGFSLIPLAVAAIYNFRFKAAQESAGDSTLRAAGFSERYVTASRNLKNAQASVDSALSDVGSAASSLSSAQYSADSNRKERAQNELKVAEANLNRAQAQLAIAKSEFDVVSSLENPVQAIVKSESSLENSVQNKSASSVTQSGLAHSEEGERWY